MELTTRVAAIKTFFNMSAKEAMEEIKELKNADPAGYEWVAHESARQIGKELRDPQT